MEKTMVLVLKNIYKKIKSLWENIWQIWVWMNLRDDARIWWDIINSKEIHALSNEEFEKVFLSRWSHVGKRDTKSTKGLFSCGNSILQVHGCIHKENIIVSINPSCMHNFINVNFAKRLQVPTKNIQITQVEGENI